MNDGNNLEEVLKSPPPFSGPLTKAGIIGVSVYTGVGAGGTGV